MKRMNFRLKKFSRLFIVLTIIGAVTLPGTLFAKTYRMKIQSGYPRGDLSMELLKVFAEAADRRSNGQIKMKVFADPEIVPGDQLFIAAKQGVVDMIHAMGGMWSGVLPVGSVEFSLPLSFKASQALTFEGQAAEIRHFVLNSGYIDVLRDEYAKQGFYFLDAHTYGPVPFVLSTKPLSNCNDLKGLKIRAEGINKEYYAALNMAPTHVAPPEAYMALKLGTVDAAEWDVSAVTGMNWHEVAPYWIRGMENDQTLGHIIFNMKKWNRLPADVQMALKAAAEEYWYATVNGYKAEIDAVEKLVGSGDVKVNVLDSACQQKFQMAANEIWKELAAEDPASAKLIELIKEFRGLK